MNVRARIVVAAIAAGAALAGCAARNASAVAPRGAAAHETTIDNARTGSTDTFGTARVGDDHYADVNGNVYKNTGSGWEEHTSGGWQSAGGNTAWATSAQQGRSAADNRFSSFQSGWADHLGGGGGGWGSRFGGGDRFGGRFGGGGLGGFRGGGFRR